MHSIFQHVAQQYGVSPEEVRTEIATAIQFGVQQQTPAIQQAWQTIGCSQAMPTPEETIAYLTVEALRRCQDMAESEDTVRDEIPSVHFKS